MATLDTALLTGNPEAYGQVQQAAQPFSGLGSYLSQQTAQANQAVPAAQAEVEQGKQYASTALSTQQQNLQNQINTALEQQKAATAAQNASVLKGLQSKTMTPEQLQALGMSQEQWDALNQAAQEAATAKKYENRNAAVMSGTTNIDLAQFLQQQNPNEALNVSNIATPEQYAQAQALQQLAAGQWSGNPLANADITQAGKAPTNLNQFNYQAALDQARNTAQAQAKAAQAYADALQAGMDEEHAQLQADVAYNNERQAGNIGSGVGTIAGGIVGSIIPGVGTLGGAALGAAAGNIAGRQAYGVYEGGKNIITRPSKANIGDVAAVATGGLTKVVESIAQVFCFDGHTEVEMADGSTKEIKKIDLGEKTKGGEVLGTIQAYVDSVYTYDGVEVSGKHAVKENGKWVRVENSEGKKFKTLGKFKVYCLITSKHRIFANGVEFADYVETDKYEDLSIDQSLEALNSVA
jgi:hypothetical protein